MSLMRERNGPRYNMSRRVGPVDTIGIDKLTPIIGAEVERRRPRAPLGNQMIDEIHRALAENSVIFFRDSI